MADRLRLVTNEESVELADKTNAWLAGPSAFMFSSARSTAQLAIMEYLANERGATIYPAVIAAQEKDDDRSTETA